MINNNDNDNNASSSAAPIINKEKRNWFLNSLTRRSKSQSQNSLSALAGNEPQLQNNNNVIAATTTGCLNSTSPSTRNVEASSSRKRKDEKSVFQIFRKKIEFRLTSLRHRRHASDETGCATTDASSEFLTHSPIHEPKLTFSFRTLEPEMIPFTHDYKRFIVKKWLEEGENSTPNRVMYKACSEMLSQVWYWGEISRRDAQKQLTDKPTGSFLVRDSETSGCQFTLSFRIVNVTLHYRLEFRDNYWHFEELQFESIVEMIEDILYRCTNDNFVCFVKVSNEMQPPFPVILKYPLSRYWKMPQLQDLCRRTIQKHVTPEEIAILPIPTKLHEYLSEKRELVFQS